MAEPKLDMAALLADLRVEFNDKVSDVISILSEEWTAVDEGRMPDAVFIENVRRHGHNLRGSAGTVGYPLVGLIAFRLEDYVSELCSLNSWQMGGIQIFFGSLQDALDGHLDDRDEAEIVRGLPSSAGFDPSDVVKMDIEAMMVMPKDTGATIMRRELEACGYTIVIVTSPFEAIEMIIRSRPDFVLISAILEGMSGADLVCALRAMPITADIPVILTTSLTDGSELLAMLPADVPVVHKGQAFSDDMVGALERLAVI